MRLLNVESFKLESYNDKYKVPPYLILSHRWGEDEVLFQDLQEVPQDEEIRELRQSLRDMEQRFERLEQNLKPERDTIGGIKDGNLEQQSSVVSKRAVENEGDGRANDIWSLPHLIRASKKKTGWNKIYSCCKEAKLLGFSYVWIDTCCINKDSSSELSEAINSMFSWYMGASVCIAYLSDVSFEKRNNEFLQSDWFTRGWTLQELLAPDDVWFYSQDWQFIALRSTLVVYISSITRINDKVLRKKSQESIRDFTVAARLSWAAIRRYTRAEDRSYSLLGLFGVNIPSIYGEGEQAAFFRLQSEIFKVNPDHSIFAWDIIYYSDKTDVCMFAPRIECFLKMSSVVSLEEKPQSLHIRAEPALKHSKVSHGIPVWLLVRPHNHHFLACLNCKIQGRDKVITIPLTEEGEGHFLRQIGDIQDIEFARLKDKYWFMKEVFVSYPRNDPQREIHSTWWGSRFTLYVDDKQTLDAGFKRTSISSCSHSNAKVNGISEILGAVADFHDLSSQSTPIRFDEIGTRTSAIVYLNEDARTVFALAIQRPRRMGFFIPRVGVVESSNLKPQMIGTLHETISETLESGWYVFIRTFETPESIFYVNLSVKPLNALKPA